MALSNAAVAAKLDKVIAQNAHIIALLTQAPVAAGDPVVASVASPVVAAPAAARPYFAASGATLKALAEAGDVDAIAEQAFRAAKRAAK